MGDKLGRYIILVLLFFGVALSGLAQQKARVTLNMSEVKVVQVLDSISGICGFSFTYNPHFIPEDSIVHVHFKEELLDSALIKLVASIPLKIEYFKQQIILSRQVLSKQNTVKRVTGKVVDVVSGDPIPYASVGYEGTFTGTITNLSGNFSIPQLLGTKHSGLKVSCIGYKSITLNPKALELGAIQLHRDVISLQEVVVRSHSPIETIEKALDNISSERYYCQTHLHTFYREIVKRNRHYVSYLESVLSIYKPNIRHGFSGYGNAHLLKSRTFFDRGTLDTLSFKLQGGVQACLDLDVVYNKPLFLSDDRADFYRFVFTDIVLINGKSSYFIRCIPLNKSALLPEGELYIDIAELTFVKIRQLYNREVSERMSNTMITKKSRGLRVKTTLLEYTTRYKQESGRYMLHHVEGIMNYRVRKKGTLFYKNYNAKFEMVTTALGVEKPQGKKLRKTSVMLQEQTPYSSLFWQNEPIILPEDDIKKALSRIKQGQILQNEPSAP